MARLRSDSKRCCVNVEIRCVIKRIMLTVNGTKTEYRATP
nr:MAG TPA: hypothetical protein [Caudoviricetes sp.]